VSVTTPVEINIFQNTGNLNKNIFSLSTPLHYTTKLFSRVFLFFPTHSALIITVITNSHSALCSRRAVGVLEDEAGEEFSCLVHWCWQWKHLFNEVSSVLKYIYFNWSSDRHRTFLLNGFSTAGILSQTPSLVSGTLINDSYRFSDALLISCLKKELQVSRIIVWGSWTVEDITRRKERRHSKPE